MNKKQTESWLPKTESSVLKDLWEEGLKKSVNEKAESTQLSTDAQLTEQDVTRPRMPRNAPTFRPDLRNPDTGLQFDHNREARQEYYDFLTYVFRVLALM